MSRSYQGITKEELSDTDYLQFWLFSMMGYRRVENIYLQFKNGFLKQEALDRIGMSFYRTPLQRQIWEERKYDFDPEFAIFETPRQRAMKRIIFIMVLSLPVAQGQLIKLLPAGPPTAPKVFLTIAGALVFTAFQR